MAISPPIPVAEAAPSGHYESVADMDAVAELEACRRALARKVKALINGRIRDGRPAEDIDHNQLKELIHEAEQIDDELEAAYYRGGPDGDGGVREPVSPQPPSRGPGTTIEPPRN
jgi:hypothetical protein